MDERCCLACIIFPLSLSETVVHGPKTQLEGKNLRTSQCATELEFSKRFYCRCVRVDESGSSQESTRKYRYGLLKRVTLKHINSSIFMTLFLRSEVKSQGILRNVLGKEWG